MKAYHAFYGDWCLFCFCCKDAAKDATTVVYSHRTFNFSLGQNNARAWLMGPPNRWRALTGEAQRLEAPPIDLEEL